MDHTPRSTIADFADVRELVQQDRLCDGDANVNTHHYTNICTYADYHAYGPTSLRLERHEQRERKLA